MDLEKRGSESARKGHGPFAVSRQPGPTLDETHFGAARAAVRTKRLIIDLLSHDDSVTCRVAMRRLLGRERRSVALRAWSRWESWAGTLHSQVGCRISVCAMAERSDSSSSSRQSHQ